MNDLVRHVGEGIETRKLLVPGQRLVVAVSGGLDSMVLLEVLRRLAGTLGFGLLIAHFNHQLRGRQSAADERFVTRWAARHGLKVVTGRGDVRKAATTEHISIEMAARQLRHRFLARVARRHRCPAVALAHHGDDQVELFFLRLFRGSGPEGLGGMRWRAPSPADPRVELIRPLLNVTKADLAAFARREGVPFREDASNLQPETDRNRIRLQLIPFLHADIAPHLEGAVLRSMELTGAESDFIAEAARLWLASNAREAFDQLHVALQRAVLRLQLIREGLAPDYELIEALRSRSGKGVSTGAGRSVRRRDDGMIVTEQTAPEEWDNERITVLMDGRAGRATFGGCDFQWSLARWTGVPVGPGTPGVELFDADRVGSVIELRHWRPGDRFQPIGLNRAVKLQDWFVNRKVAREERHRRVVAATHQGIFWVERERIGELARVTTATTRILRWSWSRSVTKGD